MTKQKYKRKPGSRGFTLVELMVSLTLFVIVIMAAISSLYAVNDASRKVEAMRTVLDNLNFAIESMSRTIRTGTNLTCSPDPVELPSYPPIDCVFGLSPEYQITIEKTIGADEVVTYKRWIVTDANGNPYGEIQRCAGECIGITAPGIDVQNLSFFVEGSGVGDQNQPKLMMFIQGVATAGANTAPFAIQTQVSVRSAE